MAQTWLRVDGGNYLAIITEGYHYRASDQYPIVAWFPGYPLVVRWVADLGIDPVVAGLAVAAAAGLAATLLFWQWLVARVPTRTCILAVAVLLTYAYGWFLFGVLYSDALHLALALGAFVLLDRDRPWLAAAVAGAATGTRPVGYAVAVALVILVLERDGVLGSSGRRRWAARWGVPDRFDRGRLRVRHLALAALSCWGVLAYSAYLWRRWGDPLLWLGVQDHWSQGPSAGPETWFKIHMAARMVRIHDPGYIASNLAQAAVLVVVVLFIPGVSRRFGFGYGVYVAVLVATVAFGTNELIGAGRYLMAAFPVIPCLARWLEQRRIVVPYLVVSAIALVALTVLFSRGAYLT